MLLVTRPVVAKAVFISAKVTENIHMRTAEANLGELSHWVCIRNHDPKAPQPPAGFGHFASAGGIPHIHNKDGVFAIDNGLWLVVFDGEPHLMSPAQLHERFEEVSEHFIPSWGQEEQWMKYRDPVVDASARPSAQTAIQAPTKP